MLPLLLLLAAPAVWCEIFTTTTEKKFLRTSITDKPTVPPTEYPTTPLPSTTDIFGDLTDLCGSPGFPKCEHLFPDGCPEGCPDGQICRFKNKMLGCHPICKKADMCFMVDHSWSISVSEYEMFIDFIKCLIESLCIPPSRTSLVQFAHKNSTFCNWNFGSAEGTDKNLACNELLVQQGFFPGHYGGRTCIWCALEICKAKFSEDDDPNCPNVAILLTDGDNNVDGPGAIDGDVYTRQVADWLKMQATVVTVGAGGGISPKGMALLDYIATSGEAFSVNNIPDLKNHINDVLCEACGCGY